jgi:hypothetical protein
MVSQPGEAVRVQEECMSEDRAKKRVFCLRNHVSKDAEEHIGCPYCFGKKREVIEDGERQEFCDFEADQDPLTFGFPDGSSRNAGG